MNQSQNGYTYEAFETIVTSDEMFGVIPFVGKDGEGFTYSREVSIGNFPFVSDDHTTVGESSGKDEEITVNKRELVEDFYVRNFAQQNLSGQVNQLDSQTMKKFKKAGRTIAEAIVGGGFITGFTMSDDFAGGPGIDALVAAGAFMDSNRYGPGTIKYVNVGTLLSYRAPGDRAFGATVSIAAGDGNYTLYSDNPSKWITVTVDASDFSADGERSIRFTSSTNSFDGLATLIHPSQVRTASGANGDALTFGVLDELLDTVKVRENLAFVMPDRLRNKVKSLLRAAGGTEPMDIMGGAFKVPTYDGIPILKNDWIPKTESKGTSTTLSSVYLASFSAEEGFWMGALGGSTFDVMADPRDVTVMGFRLEDLGQIQGGPSAVGRRLMFFGAPALGSTLAAARASQLITA